MGKSVKQAFAPLKNTTKIKPFKNPGKSAANFFSGGLINQQGKFFTDAAADEEQSAEDQAAAAEAAKKAESDARLAALLGDAEAQGSSDERRINEFGQKSTASLAATNADALNLRKQRRGELATLLAQQADNEFKLSQPEIAEESNSGGILYSSGYGTALAKEKGRIATARDLQLAQQALSDTDADIAGRREVDAVGRGYGEQGMSRNFSLQDFAREGRVAKEIGGITTAPSVKGSGKGGAMSGAMAGASAGAAAGPWGALIGGGAGALLGNESEGKKGK